MPSSPRTTAANPSAPTERTSPALSSRIAAEIFGTFLLVFGGVGAALIASTFPDADNAVGIGHLGVALAFGLTVIGAAYAVGHVSGGHFNPAVTVGLALGRRFPARDIAPYVLAQLIGGVVATSLLYLVISHGPAGMLATAVDGGFASNGYDARSPGGFDMVAAIVTELVLTAVFLFVIMGVTHEQAPAGFAPLAIGLTLTLIHLVSIPVDNTSVNPARSIATAIYGGPEALGQVWLFIVVPLVAAALAGLSHRLLFSRSRPGSTR